MARPVEIVAALHHLYVTRSAGGGQQLSAQHDRTAGRVRNATLWARSPSPRMEARGRLKGENPARLPYGGPGSCRQLLISIMAVRPRPPGAHLLCKHVCRTGLQPCGDHANRERIRLRCTVVPACHRGEWGQQQAARLRQLCHRSCCATSVWLRWLLPTGEVGE